MEEAKSPDHNRHSLATSHVRSRTNLWLLLIPLLGLSPLLLFRLAEWIKNPDTFYALISIPLGFGLLLRQWKEREESANPVLERRVLLSAGLTILSAALSAFSVIYFLPWLASVSALLVLAAWSIQYFDRIHWASSISWLAVPAAIVVLPDAWCTSISSWLIDIAAANCSSSLDAFGIPNILLGSNIELVDRLIVARALCGGWGSLFLLLSIAVSLVVYQRRSCLNGFLTTLLCPLWMTIGHYGLLMSVALSASYLKQELTVGAGYYILSGFFFLTAVLAGWLSSVVLHGAFESVEQKSTELRPAFGLINAVFYWPATPPPLLPTDAEDREILEAQLRQRQQELAALPRVFWFESRISSFSIRTCASAILLLGLLPTIVLIQGNVRPAFADRVVAAETATKIGALELPPKLDDALIRPIGQGGPPGESKSWAIQVGQRSLTLSIEHSFQGWHDPTLELVQRGWSPILKLRIEQFGNRNWGIFGTSLQTDLGAFAYIFNSMLTEQLKELDVVPNFRGGSIASETAYQRKTIFDLLRGDVRSTDTTSVQLLLEVNSGEQLLEPEINKIVQLYDSLRRELKQ